MPEKVSALSYKVVFTKAEFAIMRRGLDSSNVDDKWLVLCKGLTLSFYRRWTGHCIYQLELVSRGGQYHVLQALVNRDSSEYAQQNADYDARILHFVIRGILLGERIPFPLAPSPVMPNKAAPELEPLLPSDATESSPSSRPWWKFW